MRIRLIAATALAGTLFLSGACDKSGRPAEDKASLDSAVAAAFELHASAVEGTEHGMHRMGSKNRFLRAIYRARRVARNVKATQADVDTAAVYLKLATMIFHDETVDADAEVFTGMVEDTIMIPRMKLEHKFIFTMKRDNTYTLFDTVGSFREKVFLQKGRYEKHNGTCTFTSTLCMTLDIVTLQMVLDTLMTPYSGEIKGDTMTIDEFGYLGAASFARERRIAGHHGDR